MSRSLTGEARRKRATARVTVALGVAGLSLLALPAAAAGAAEPWQVGAAKVDITPPKFSPAQDAIDFGDAVFGTAGCPGTRGTYTGPRPYRFEEPYVDVDGSGEFNYAIDPNDPLNPGDQYCDANGNGRWDGLYLSGGIDSIARLQPNGDAAHDPIDARAIAVSDGTRKVVIVSVVAQGLFENYTNRMRDRAKLGCGSIDEVIVSANHNESSPDTIGIYGGPDLGGVAGGHSGIDDYYMDYLVERVAEAAKLAACDNLEPGTIRATQFQLPSNLAVRLSHNFPTTNDDRSPAAIDPKVRVLQARDGNGAAIFTVMNLAAHNQEIGHDAESHDLSSDWPGAFHRRLEQLLPGMAMFLVGDNGSEEDPKTVPDADVSACAGDEKCAVYTQAKATGEAFAETVAGHLADADPIAAGAVSAQRDVFDVPVENHAFQAAFAAGLFGTREAIPCSTPSSGTCIHTEVSSTRIGPDVQLLGNPGEAFPALMVGGPWGIEDAGCPSSDTIDRSNPPVPNFHARSPYRFQIGLSDDMIGYEIPAWAFSSAPGIFTTNCVNDPDSDRDPRGHQHKLETEGVGPTGSNLVAKRLSALLDQSPDPAASVRRGRYVFADGSLSRRPWRAGQGGSEDAVAVWLADPGSDTLAPGSGRIVALDSVGFFGNRPVDDHGEFMDYDGLAEADPGIITRGMIVPGASQGSVSKRFYLNLYPALSGAPLGAARPPPGGGGGGPPTPCKDVTAPESVPRGRSLSSGSFAINGTAHDVGCEPGPGERKHTAGLARVDLNVSQLQDDGSCRFLLADGRLARKRPCSRPIFNRADGRRKWSRTFGHGLSRGRWRVRARARDTDGNIEPPDERNIVRFRVR